jgi:hypothetical protein
MNDLANSISREFRLETIAVEVEANVAVAAERILVTGKLLCEARELLPSNQAFGAWREERLPWLTSRIAQHWMNAWENGGEGLLRNNFATTAIYQLTAPSVPESAREEAIERAQAGESITVQQAKEIAALHKQIELAKQQLAAAEPSLDDLIPELRRLHTSGDIPQRTALEFSKLHQDVQRGVVLPKFQAVIEQKRQIAQLEQDKARALERESQAREAREALQADYDAAVEEGAQKLIAEKDAEIARKARELEQLRVDLRDKIEREQTAAIEKRVRAEWEAKLEAERKERERAERKARQVADRCKLISEDHMRELKRREDAEAKLKAAHPIEKDGIHARTVGFIKRDLEATIKKLEADTEQHQRVMSNAALQEIGAMLGEYFGAQTFIEG